MPRMEMRPVPFIVILLSLMVITDARNIESASTDGSASSPCDKCLVVARKAEATLNDQKLLHEARNLSEEACHVFPTMLQDKCLKKSGDYLHEAKLILQAFFEEENLCKGTGLCAKSEPIDDNDACLELPEETLDVIEDERSCVVCRKAVRKLITRIKQPKMQTKIVEAILDYCEEADEDEEQCKRTVFRYGPIILAKLEKFKASELCSMMGECGQKTKSKCNRNVFISFA